jgi:cobalt-zinc-cadmium efflux system outer membrane protein
LSTITTPAVAPAAFNEASIDPESTDPEITRQSSDFTTLSEPLTFAKLISEAEFGDAIGSDSTTDLASLEAIAQANHPELQQARALITQSRGKAQQARLPYNPVFQYQSDEMGVTGVSGLHSVALSQRFVTADKLGIAQQEQLQIVQRRMAEYELSRLRVLTRVRAAFAELLIAQDRTVITESIAKLASRSADTVKSLMDAGEVSRIAFLQARVEAERAELVSRNAVAKLKQKQRALAATVGVEALPTETVRGEPSSQLQPQPWLELADEVAAISPQLSSAGAQLQSARWALQLACAQVTPDVTGQIGVGYDAGTDDTYGVVGVSVPLPIRNRNQGNIRAARASVTAASANIDRKALQLRNALADAVGRYEIARETYTQLREQISPNAKEAFDLAGKAFESGEADFLQVLTAQRTWFDTRLAAINALETAKIADAEIKGVLTTVVQ